MSMQGSLLNPKGILTFYFLFLNLYIKNPNMSNREK